MQDMMAQAQETFVNESLDLLQGMEISLNQLADQPDDVELINSVFRAAHTIKGSAGLFGLDDIVSFTHKVENVLDQVRAGKVEIQAALIEVLLECKDHIEVLIEQIGLQADVGIASKSAVLIEALLKQAHGTQSLATTSAAETDIKRQESPVPYQPHIGREERHSVASD